MKESLKRYGPLAGTAVLAAVVLLRLFGQEDVAQTVENVGGSLELTQGSPVGKAELTAAAAATVGVFLKIRSELRKARGR